jgi:hypothetical protein
MSRPAYRQAGSFDTSDSELEAKYLQFCEGLFSIKK